MCARENQELDCKESSSSENRQLWNHVYTVGIGSALGSLVLAAWFKDFDLFSYGSIVFTIAAVMGFCGTTYPSIRKLWGHWLGKWLTRACHVALFFLAIIPAKTLVSSALGLPGQDYDSTVGILMLAVYPALWLLLLALICIIIGFLQFITWILIQVTKFPVVDDIVRFIGRSTTNERLRHLIFEKRRVNGYFSFAQCAGAFITAVLLIYCYDSMGKSIADNDQIIKSIAFYTDYQIADNYPGIKKGFRYRLHENGVVSYAIMNKGKVEIVVDKIPGS